MHLGGTAALGRSPRRAQQNRTFPRIGVLWHAGIPTVIANKNHAEGDET
jgi:hypothetical protein